MKRIRVVGLAVVAICAMSAMAAASAVAHEFNATEMGNITSKSLQTQVFHTAAGNVECTAVKVVEGVAVLKSATQTATVQYEKCKAFGLTATVSPAKYEFQANGSVKLLGSITIKATECLVTVPTGQVVGPVSFRNNGKLVEIVPSVKNITSSGTGTACSYASESVGTYVGTSSVGMASGVGTVEWK